MIPPSSPYDRTIHLRQGRDHPQAIALRVTQLRTRVENYRALDPDNRNLFYVDRQCGRIERDHRNHCSLHSLLQDLASAEAGMLALEVARGLR